MPSSQSSPLRREVSSPWSTSYVEGAATLRVSIYRPDGSLFCDDASNYDTPENGVRLCGQTDDGKQPTTVAAYSMRPAIAELNWRLAREVAMCGREEADFVVDLCIAGSIEDDFWSNRQLWPRAIEAWNTAAAAGCVL